MGCEADDYNAYADAQLAEQESSRILVIGDSVMWWGLEQQASVSDGMSQVLGEPVVNLSVPGARISAPDPQWVAEGLDIHAQYRSKAWDWVVVEGGANDLAEECRCNACDGVLDELIAEGGASGEIPDLVQDARADGARVVVVGYYAPPLAGGEFAACADELSVLSSRIETLANRTGGVTYVSMAEVVDPSDAGAYDPDLIHPSATSSLAIGRLIAEVIEAEEN